VRVQVHIRTGVPLRQHLQAVVELADARGIAGMARQQRLHEHHRLRRFLAQARQDLLVGLQDVPVGRENEPRQVVGANQQEDRLWLAADDLVEPFQHALRRVVADAPVAHRHPRQHLVPDPQVGEAVAQQDNIPRLDGRGAEQVHLAQVIVARDTVHQVIRQPEGEHAGQQKCNEDDSRHGLIIFQMDKPGQGHGV